MHRVQEFVRSHPQITAWVALAAAMVVVLFIAARDVKLLPTQMATLTVSTVLLAGLCVWIIHWE